MHVFASFLVGLLFGTGLVISGLINPAKVLNFLDIAGTWDPSLAFTMGGAVLTTALGYKLTFGRGKPLLSDRFHVPSASDIDMRLVSGAALFGIGWGLVGYCPGPAIAALSSGGAPTAIFVIAMLAGMAIARNLTSPLARRAESRSLPAGSAPKLGDPS